MYRNGGMAEWRNGGILGSGDNVQFEVVGGFLLLGLVQDIGGSYHIIS